MVGVILATGESWLAFKDACAIRTPQDHTGTVRCASYATEQVLATGDDETAAGSLGSIVLDAHLDAAGALDLPLLRATVRLAVRALDNVLDLHRFPTETARRAAQRHRPLGLGVMGLAQALHARGLAFASAEAVAFGDECFEALAHSATLASAELAAERGPYPTFKGSKWDRGLFPADTLARLEQERGLSLDVTRGGRLDWQPVRELVAAHGLRNSALLALSATPFIDRVAGTSPSVEPCARNLQVESTLSGEFIVVAPALVRDLKARGLWDQEMIDNLKYFDGEVPEIASIPDDLKRKHLTAGEIDPLWVLRAAAARQKWIDQAQTLSLSLPRAGADVAALSSLLLAAWHMGLKSVWRVAPAHSASHRPPAA